jgi:putative addiction module component (TIGR02574 family)
MAFPSFFGCAWIMLKARDALVCFSVAAAMSGQCAPERSRNDLPRPVALTEPNGECYNLIIAGMEECAMPTELTQELLNDAMRLPDEQRAALAAALIESLDPSVDEDAEAAWSVEIARRLREVETGEVKTIPWLQARQMIAADEPPDV